MKITKLLLLSIAVILFSCGEDDEPMPTSQAMVGSWAITSVDYKGSTTTTAQGMSLKADFSGTGKNMTLASTFAANPNTVTTQGSYTIVLKTTMAGQTETEEYTVDEIFSDGTWTLDGRTLTITDINGTEKATIVEQTATSLKLKMEVKETETDQGITVTTNVTALYTFTKK
jgi:hypothetical protein